MPYGEQGDEKFYVIRTLRMVFTGELNPHWFGHPASLWIYTLTFVFWLSKVSGLVPAETLEFARHFADPITYDAHLATWFLIGRYLASFLFVASIPLVYLLGRAVYSRRVGLFAAFLFSSCPMMIGEAQILRPDMMDVFLSLLSLTFCMRLADSPSRLNGAVAGASIGLAVADKWPAVALVAPIFVASIGESVRTRKWRDLPGLIASLGLTSALSALLAFSLVVPFIFFEIGTAFENLLFENRDYGVLWIGQSGFKNLVWYLTYALPNTMTLPILVSAGVGAIFAVINGSVKRWILVSYAVVFLCLVSFANLHVCRWLTPLVPIVMLFSASAIDSMASFISKRLSSEKASTIMLAVLALVLSSVQLRNLSAMQTLRARFDSSVEMRNWMMRNLPAGSKLMVDRFKSVPLAESGLLGVEDTMEVLPWVSPGDLYNRGYRYFVANSLLSEAYRRTPSQYPFQCQFYDQLERQGRKLKVVEPPYSLSFLPLELYPDMTLTVYELSGPAVPESPREVMPESSKRRKELLDMYDAKLSQPKVLSALGVEKRRQHREAD